MGENSSLDRKVNLIRRAAQAPALGGTSRIGRAIAVGGGFSVR